MGCIQQHTYVMREGNASTQPLDSLGQIIFLHRDVLSCPVNESTLGLTPILHSSMSASGLDSSKRHSKTAAVAPIFDGLAEKATDFGPTTGELAIAKS